MSKDAIKPNKFGLTQTNFVIDCYRNIETYTFVIDDFNKTVGLDRFDVDELNRNMANHMVVYGKYLAEATAICKHIESHLEELMGEMWKQMNESYFVKLTNKDIEKYINSNKQICTIRECLISAEMVRDQLQAITIALKEAYFAIRSIISERKVQAQEISK